MTLADENRPMTLAERLADAIDEHRSLVNTDHKPKTAHDRKMYKALIGALAHKIENLECLIRTGRDLNGNEVK